jgi:hypothetical protein
VRGIQLGRKKQISQSFLCFLGKFTFTVITLGAFNFLGGFISFF